MNKILNDGLKERIEAELKKGRNVVIYTHVNPDGDAVGSSTALALLLGKLGYSVDILIPNGLPDFLKWLPGSERITICNQDVAHAKEITARAGMMFFLDFNDPKRLETLENDVLESNAFKVLIDHHEDPVDFADVTISKPGMSSVGEMIHGFISEMGHARLMDHDIATSLYVAIMTDTGNFRHSSSYPEVFRVAGELMNYDIDKDEIFTRIYDSYSLPRMQLLGYCMQEKMVYLEEYHTAYISITREELKRFSYRIGDTEGFVNIPFSIQGVRFTALFIEKEHHIKASFRSKGTFSVDRYAREHFNGGGHINAAGGESPLNMEQTLKKFEETLSLYRHELAE